MEVAAPETGVCFTLAWNVRRPTAPQQVARAVADLHRAAAQADRDVVLARGGQPGHLEGPLARRTPRRRRSRSRRCRSGSCTSDRLSLSVTVSSLKFGASGCLSTSSRTLGRELVALEILPLDARAAAVHLRLQLRLGGGRAVVAVVLDEAADVVELRRRVAAEAEVLAVQEHAVLAAVEADPELGDRQLRRVQDQRLDRLVVDQGGLGLDLHVHAAAQVDQQPGQGGVGLLDQVDRTLHLLTEERALRRRAAELRVGRAVVGVGLRLGAQLVDRVVGVQLDRERDLVALYVGRTRRLRDRQLEWRVAVEGGVAGVPELQRGRRLERHRVTAGGAELVGGPVRERRVLVARPPDPCCCASRTTWGCGRSCSWRRSARTTARGPAGSAPNGGNRVEPVDVGQRAGQTVVTATARRDPERDRRHEVAEPGLALRPRAGRARR